MIVVDTSALLAIVLNEPDNQQCQDAIVRADEILISAGTLTEALVVGARRDLRQELASLLDSLGLTVEPLTEAGARAAGNAYDRWGKGLHSAKLNLADCFAYALAKERNCPLLFVGDDFSRTDIIAALTPSGFHEP